MQHHIDAPQDGVLVHCAAGRDRTGMLIAVRYRTGQMTRVGDQMLTAEDPLRSELRDALAPIC